MQVLLLLHVLGDGQHVVEREWRKGRLRAAIAAVDRHIIDVDRIRQILARRLVGVNRLLKRLALHLLLGGLELLGRVAVIRLELPRGLEVLERVLVLAQRHVRRAAPIVRLVKLLVELYRDGRVGDRQTVVLHLEVAEGAVGVKRGNLRVRLDRVIVL